jgi:spermidine/putrescine transport system permease protein
MRISALRVSGLGLYMAVVFLFLFAPIVLVVLFSFHSSAALGFPFRGFSLRWYEDVLASDQVRQAALNSLRVSLTAALVVCIVATPAALAMSRYRFRGKAALRMLFVAPAALPFLFIGIALLTFFVRLNVGLSLWTVSIGHIVATLPIFYLAVSVRLTRFDPKLEECARDLGANAFQAFRRVTLPLIGPAVVAGLLLVMAISLDELLITIFTTGADVTLPVLIWTQVRISIDPSINAIATLLLLASLAFLLFLRRLPAELNR